jgi:hypothetical protein
LVYCGIEVREDEVMQIARTRKSSGTSPAGIVRALHYFGVGTAAGPTTVNAIRAAIDRRHPTILALQAYRSDTSKPYAECWNDGHYVAAIGYDASAAGGGSILFEDPSSYKRTWLSAEELKERWHDVGPHGERLRQWGCIVQGRPTYRPGDSQHME